MKKVTVENYRTDKCYLRIVKATAELLTEQGYVAPVRLFQKMELLTEQDIARLAPGPIALFGKSHTLQSCQGQPDSTNTEVPCARP